MRHLALLALPLAVWAQTAPPDTTAILRGVEKRYNSTSTLQAAFTMTFKDRGRPRLPERGTLYLSKPNRTRWEYSTPAGDLFLSDGKFTYDYNKQKNTTERAPFKETDDMRIPLSFLLGKLDFQKDFDSYTGKRDGTDTLITLTPRNKKLLFKEIALVVTPDFTIRHVTVTDQAGTSAMEYDLDAEQRNMKLADALFKFAAPPGARVVEVRE